MLTILEIGTRREIGGAVAPIIYAAKQLVIPLTSGLTSDAGWLESCARVRGTSDGLPQIGQSISVERQLAIRTGLILRDELIPFDHFGYDDSMRGKVMEAFLWAMGQAPLIVSYVGEPDDTPMYPAKWTGDGRDRRLVTWKDEWPKNQTLETNFRRRRRPQRDAPLPPERHAVPRPARPPPVGGIRRQPETRRRKQS